MWTERHVLISYFPLSPRQSFVSSGRFQKRNALFCLCDIIRLILTFLLPMGFCLFALGSTVYTAQFNFGFVRLRQMFT
jgi:hypothetical protein